jgi:hypothetical protein
MVTVFVRSVMTSEKVNFRNLSRSSPLSETPYRRVNFRNLSPYSPLSEKPYRRSFAKSFDFALFNGSVIQAATSEASTLQTSVRHWSRCFESAQHQPVAARCHLAFIFRGQAKNRSARRKYDGKVDLADLRRFSWVTQLQPGVDLYTQRVWHPSLQPPIRLAA